MTSDQRKLIRIEDMIMDYGGIDGSHHKQWVLAEIVRVLNDDDDKKYNAWVKVYCDGDEGKDTYEWDEGIAP